MPTSVADAGAGSYAGSNFIILATLLSLIIGLAVKVVLGIVVGNIAKKKGYSFGGFFVLGLFFFIIGLIVALCLDDKNAQMDALTNALNQSRTSNSEELLRLKTLLDENVITQEEFDEKKKQLLGL